MSDFSASKSWLVRNYSSCTADELIRTYRLYPEFRSRLRQELKRIRYDRYKWSKHDNEILRMWGVISSYKFS